MSLTYLWAQWGGEGTDSESFSVAICEGQGGFQEEGRKGALSLSLRCVEMLLECSWLVAGCGRLRTDSKGPPEGVPRSSG